MSGLPPDGQPDDRLEHRADGQPDDRLEHRAEDQPDRRTQREPQDRLEQRLGAALRSRAAAVEASPGGWAAIARRTAASGRRRRRLLTVGLPAVAVAAVLVVVGLVALTGDDGPGSRLRTNPALPGDGPAPPSTTTEPPESEPEVVTSGPGWHLLVGRRDDVGWCGQVQPQRQRQLDPSFCGASEKEFEERGVSFAFAGRPDAGGAPTTLQPAIVAYGFVPVESADVVFSLDSGAVITIAALPFDGALDAFAGELPAGSADPGGCCVPASVDEITVYDGDGRVLYREDLRAAD